MITTYATFVQNTIYPLLDNIKEIIDKAEDKGLPITRESMAELLESLFLAHIITEGLRLLTSIAITVIICVTAYKILA